jgi:hypothetical protein
MILIGSGDGMTTCRDTALPRQSGPAFTIAQSWDSRRHKQRSRLVEFPEQATTFQKESKNRILWRNFLFLERRTTIRQTLAQHEVS